MIQLTYLVKVDGTAQAITLGLNQSGALCMFEDGSVDFYVWDRLRINLMEAQVAFRDNQRILDNRVEALKESQ